MLYAIKKILNEKGDNDIDLNFIKFSTVTYDNEIFQKYIIEEDDKIRKEYTFDKDEEISKYPTESIKRVIEAFNYLEKELKGKDKESLKEIIEIIKKAQCTINISTTKRESTQIFIFENNRGKNPTNLEITKTKLMYFIYSSFHQKDVQERLLKELESCFSLVYTEITQLERYIQEDKVLGIALRRYCKTLKISTINEEIEKELFKEKDLETAKKNYNELLERLELDKESKISMENENEKILDTIKEEKIRVFLNVLKESFELISKFIKKGLGENSEDYRIHSLINLGIPVDIYPLIIDIFKKYEFDDRCGEFFEKIENLLLRNAVIKTRASLSQRLNEEIYKTSNLSDISTIIESIDNIIKEKWYWSDDKFHEALKNNSITSYPTKYILWKYENHLREKENIAKINYKKIEKLHVEHIAPQTENKELNSGFPKYDEEFERVCKNSYGNFILLNGTENSSLQNSNLFKKISVYKESEAVQELKLKHISEVIDKKYWGHKEIKERNKNILKFIDNKIKFEND